MAAAPTAAAAASDILVSKTMLPTAAFVVLVELEADEGAAGAVGMLAVLGLVDEIELGGTVKVPLPLVAVGVAEVLEVCRKSKM